MGDDKSAVAPNGVYEVVQLKSGRKDVLTADEIVEKYATNEDKTEVNRWFWAFVENDVFQRWVHVQVTPIAPHEIFAQLYDKMKDAESQYRQAKKSLQPALLDVLSSVTKDEIKAGPIHKATDSKAAKAQYTIVEKYLLQAGPDLKTFLPKYEDQLPSFVVKEIKRIQTERARVAANRLAGKKGE